MKYGLIGEKLPHSYSKVIHGFLGNGEYELCELPPAALEDFLLKADFKGVNVTIPYKEKVIPYCVLDDTAKRIGSVNTIVNKNGTLYGYNTDYFGFSAMVKRASVSFFGKKVVVLGSGGTSKTAVSAARDGGAGEVVVISRNGENNYGNITRHADCEILVNTTPVGMFPGNAASPVPLGVFTKLSAVIDVIYNPLSTRLVLDARDRGIPASGGIVMLTAQAVRAHNLFFDIKPDEREESMCVEDAILKAEKMFSNIVLIGMPGSGKTTLGRELAARLERGFVDTDELIETRTGRKIPDIIETDGEPFFRELERGVVAEVSAKSGLVIATGGGSVLAKENRDALRQNGVVIFLERPPEKLATNGRPLSVNVNALYKERLPLYKSMARFTLYMDDDVKTNIEKAMTLL